MEPQKIEIARSFSRTVQIEPYQPVSFFCSMKAEVLEVEAELVGKKLSNRCVLQVQEDINAYIEEHKP